MKDLFVHRFSTRKDKYFRFLGRTNASVSSLRLRRERRCHITKIVDIFDVLRLCKQTIYPNVRLWKTYLYTGFQPERISIRSEFWGEMHCLCSNDVTLQKMSTFLIFCAYANKWYIEIFVYERPICTIPVFSQKGWVFHFLGGRNALCQLKRHHITKFADIFYTLRLCKQMIYHNVRRYKTYLYTDFQPESIRISLFGGTSCSVYAKTAMSHYKICRHFWYIAPMVTNDISQCSSI